MFLERNEVNRELGDDIRSFVVRGIVDDDDFCLLRRVIEPAQGLKAVRDFLRSVSNGNNNGDIRIFRKGWKTLLFEESLTNQIVEEDLSFYGISMLYPGEDISEGDKFFFHGRFKKGRPMGVENHIF
jgi:hypothetical protein